MDGLIKSVMNGQDPEYVFSNYLKEEIEKKKPGFIARVKNAASSAKQFVRDPSVRQFGRELGRGVALAVGTHQLAKHINNRLDRK